MSQAEHPVLPRGATDERGRLIPLSPEEIRVRNAETIRALESLDQMGDDVEQRETLEALMKALGPDRVISNRPLFP